MSLLLRPILVFPIILGASIALANVTPASTPKTSGSVSGLSKIGNNLREKLSHTNKRDKRQIMVYLTKTAKRFKFLSKSHQSAASRKTRLRYVYSSKAKAAMLGQAQLVKYLKNRNFSFQQFYITNMIVIQNADGKLIRYLSSRDDVSRILDNAIFEKEDVRKNKTKRNTVSEIAPTGIGANLTAAGAQRVWDEFNVRGENIVVAGQDTGIQWDHPALKANYRGTQTTNTVHDYSWHDSIKQPIGRGRNSCGYNLEAPCDDNGHGTHTIGTVIGNDHNGTIIGMAPNAKWIGCRNMDAGNGRPSTYIECFEYFLAPYPFGGNPLTDGNPEMAPHVINNSWGCPSSEMCEGDEFIEILETLKDAGIMVIASAGNDGSSCASISTGPAHHTDLAFTVGAINHRNDSIARFSSRGPSAFDGKIGPDVTAPGVSIRSSIPGGRYAGGGWSGTSMAGPHVVGQVALIWSAVPSLIGNIDTTAEIIRSTSRPMTSRQNCAGTSGLDIPNNTFGHGIIDAFAAVQKAIELYGTEVIEEER